MNMNVQINPNKKTKTKIFHIREIVNLNVW